MVDGLGRLVAAGGPSAYNMPVEPERPPILDYASPPEPDVAAQNRRRSNYWWGYVTAAVVTGISLLGMGLAFLGIGEAAGGLFCLMLGLGFVIALIFAVQWACAPEPGQKIAPPGRGMDGQNS